MNMTRKYDKVLTFNIVHFPNFEISAFQKLISARGSYQRKYGIRKKTKY